MSPLLEVRGLCVSLGGRRILDDVHLALEAGRFGALLGPNGSGKTTLERAVLGWLPRERGSILIDGRPLESLSPRGLARSVAAVRQEHEGHPDFLVEELIALGRAPHTGALRGLDAEDRASVERAMALTETAALAGRRVGTLSGGERQRVWLALALAQSPRLLVLDEPTNHLDVAHQLDLLARVRELGIGVLAALHDLSLAARFADVAWILSEGRVVDFGPCAELLVPERLEPVFGVSIERAVGSTGHAFFAYDRPR